MKLMVIGSGYVGLVTGSCFADMGNDVWCVDSDEKKIKNLKQGIIPIYEPGLEEMVTRNFEEGRLKFTTSVKDALKESLFVFIAVCTPSGEDGSADLQHVLSVARNIGEHMERYVIVVNKSTVPVGTAESVRSEISRELVKRGKTGLEFDVVSNPEFLKEGSAIEDFLRADRVVIGTDNFRAGELMKELYDPFQRKGEKILIMDVKSAELTKYAANAMLAVRISFMNEIAALCEACGADIEKVREGIGSDSRIGRSFLYAGIGYGGSCFPKDIKAIIRIEKEFGIEPRILPAVEEVNRLQRSRFVNRVLETLGSDLTGKVLAVWGLAFKPQTDDMREAPSIDILGGLKKHGARFRVFDPVAMKTAREVLGDEGIEYVTNYYEALQGAEALLLLTEWHQFRRPDYDKMKALMKNHIVFDGRNQYEPIKMREKGFKYYCVGRP